MGMACALTLTTPLHAREANDIFYLKGHYRRGTFCDLVGFVTPPLIAFFVHSIKTPEST